MKKLLLMTSMVIPCAIIVLLLQTKTKDTLILGTMSGIPPYVSMTTTGEYEGFDIEVAQEIAKRLDKKLVIQDMDTIALITALKQGRVDFLMTGLDITQDRLKEIAMIPYQGEPINQMALVFWKEIPKGITSLDDMSKEMIICVEPGSSPEGILNQYSNLTIKSCDPLPSMLEIQYGKATATFMDARLYQRLQATIPELKALMIQLNEPLLGCGIGIKKENKELIEKITALIGDLKLSVLPELEQRWFGKVPQ